MLSTLFIHAKNNQLLLGFETRTPQSEYMKQITYQCAPFFCISRLSLQTIEVSILFTLHVLKFLASNPSQKVLKYTKTVNSILRTFIQHSNFYWIPHPLPIPLPPCVVFLIVVDQEAKNHLHL